MREPQHDFWRNLRNEFATGRPWLDRAVVLTYAVLTGLVVVGFTLLAEVGGRGFEVLRGLGAAGPWLTLVWTPALAVALLWWTRRFVPGAQGSGIAQVIAALDEKASSDERLRFVSLRLSLQKVVLVSGALLAGMSMGREGPTVQVGAGVMQHARRFSYFGELRVQRLD